MIIPSTRESELLSKSDPLFKESFKYNGWRYVLLPDLTRLNGFTNPTIAEIGLVAKELTK